jgi:hypothetical protein
MHEDCELVYKKMPVCSRRRVVRGRPPDPGESRLAQLARKKMPVYEICDTQEGCRQNPPRTPPCEVPPP